MNEYLIIKVDFDLEKWLGRNVKIDLKNVKILYDNYDRIFFYLFILYLWYMYLRVLKVIN